jgi:hypothetical protein
MDEEAITEWEPILTVHDYYDGPRSGIAQYRGQAHAYKCKWDEALDDWGREYLLSPIDPNQLAAVCEDWQIWRRYQTQHANGTLQVDDQHPALAADWPRHAQLMEIVTQALEVSSIGAIRAIPDFRAAMGSVDDLEARWRTL